MAPLPSHLMVTSIELLYGNKLLQLKSSKAQVLFDESLEEPKAKKIDKNKETGGNVDL